MIMCLKIKNNVINASSASDDTANNRCYENKALCDKYESKLVLKLRALTAA